MKNFTLKFFYYFQLTFIFCVWSNHVFAQSDDCSSAAAISDGVTAFSTVGFTGSDETSCAFNDINDGWYIYTASCTGDVTVSTCNDADFDTSLSAFDGCGGTELACNDDETGCVGNTSEIMFTVTSGTQYWIRIAGYSGATGTGNITISCASNNNDDCANAFAISDGVTAFSTVGFTGSDETSCAFNDINDGWYIYTASCTGDVTVSTCNDADFDTSLSAFDGCGGTELACNDDETGCVGNISEIMFTVTSGTQYWIRIAGYSGATGTGNITISCASNNNDDCANAFAISDGVTAFSTVGFTGSDETSCAFNDINDGWYIYTASCTGDVTVSTCNDADFDTSLSAFDGCGGTELACNDDETGCVGNTSEIMFTVTSGTQYWIRIAGYNGATGTGNITISCVVPVPANDECVNAIEVVNPSSTPGTTVNATTTGEPPTCGTTVDAGGVWYTFVSTIVEEVTIELCGAPYDSKIGVYTGSCGNFDCVIGEDDDIANCGGNDPSVTFTTTGNLVAETYYIYVNGFNGSQGTFDLDIVADPLPVELTSFEGEVMENYNKLMWETVSESNTEIHVIERSADGRDNWEVIGQVTAAGNTFDAQQYHLEDINPIAQAYYRLKTVDFDGYMNYSDIILLKRSIESFELIGIAPNPVSTVVSVDFQTPQQGQYTIRMTNLVGQIVYTEQLNLDTGIHSKDLLVSTLANGVYFITIENGIESLVHKIIKQ